MTIITNFGRRHRKLTAAFALAVVVVGAGSFAVAQRYRYSRYGETQTGVHEITERNGTPDWQVDPNFKSDVFTFVRVRYRSGYGPRHYTGQYPGRGGGWTTDMPDSDMNFSFRLQQLTALKVDPNPKNLSLTDPELFDYPFIYIVEPGRLEFTDEEVVNLRRYLLNGGFLMVDDFWGEAEYENFYEQIKQVFPEREPQELPPDHPLFHCVFDLKQKPQIPNIRVAMDYRGTNVTWERDGYDPTTKEVHYKGIFDDKGRMMVIICHNTDLGDGWEREGEDEYFFREFSEKKGYPMGINIIFYAMTH